jgi:hypothetical protein
MSAHFSILQEAGLIEAEKIGRTIYYRLKMSVLEEALLGFAQTLGWEMSAPEGAQSAVGEDPEESPNLKETS